MSKKKRNSKHKNRSELKVSNEIERRFYSGMIIDEFNYTHWKDAPRGEKEINDAILKEIPDEVKRKEFIRQAKVRSNETNITSDAYDWLKEERCYCFIFYTISEVLTKRQIEKIISYRKNNNWNEYDINRDGNEVYYRILSFELTPSTKDEYIESIKIFISKVAREREEKIKLINELKQRWLLIENNDYLSWLDEKDKEQIEWARNYLKKYNDRFLFFDAYRFASPLVQLKSFFDTWNIRVHERKELLVIKMKKAWAQEKYREKIKDKKIINAYIPIDTKEKLDMMAKRDNKKMNEFLIYLIEKEYVGRGHKER
ncbi:TPA: hypothetical protein SMQ12_001656 [Proteus mirabilis]|nr:hypothetical protein [Proteus mirabilis]HEK1023593.1 hypothetical protein [Proteus mirabilis]HEK1945263.1 hypothetical protein [Proteus mirabilis]HEK2746529.1 hypothetical protein [Proteus mirabilis]